MKNNKWIWVALILLVIAIFFITKDSGQTQTKKLVSEIEYPMDNLAFSFQSTMYGFRLTYDGFAPINDFIALRNDAGMEATSKFANPPQDNQDILLSHYAYTIEKTGYHQALPILIDYLEKNYNNDKLAFSHHMVTHTIKVLDSQPDVNKNYAYTQTQMLETIDKAKTI